MAEEYPTIWGRLLFTSLSGLGPLFTDKEELVRFMSLNPRHSEADREVLPIIIDDLVLGNQKIDREIMRNLRFAITQKYGRDFAADVNSHFRSVRDALIEIDRAQRAITNMLRNPPRVVIAASEQPLEEQAAITESPMEIKPLAPMDISNLLNDPTLWDQVGGVQSVNVWRQSAKSRRRSQLQLEGIRTIAKAILCYRQFSEIFIKRLDANPALGQATLDYPLAKAALRAAGIEHVVEATTVEPRISEILDADPALKSSASVCAGAREILDNEGFTSMVESLAKPNDVPTRFALYVLSRR